VKTFFELKESLQESTFMVTIRKGKFGGVNSDGRPTMVTARSGKEAVTRAAKKVGIDPKLITTGDYTVKGNTKESVELGEAKIEVGDRVRVKDDAKKVVDRSRLGKSGVVLPNGMGGSSIRVKFADGKTAMFNKNDLEVNESVELGESALAKQWQSGKSSIKSGSVELIRGKSGVHTIKKGGKTIGDFSLDYDDWVVNIKGKKGQHTLGSIDDIVKMASSMKESVELGEARKSGANYEVYHKDFSTAVQYAKKEVEKKGYEIDDDEWFRKVASGPRKPSKGKTNSYNIELTKGGKTVKQRLQMQVYGMDSGKYELNYYVS